MTQQPATPRGATSGASHEGGRGTGGRGTTGGRGDPRSGSTTARHPSPGWALLAALIGGMCGTGLRLLVDILLPHSDAQFPLGTIVANVVGAFVLALIVARFWSGASEWLKAGLGAGLLGSFTTFSAVMVSLVAQTATGLWMMAAAYLLLSLGLGLAAAALGLRVGRIATPIDWVDE